MIPNNDTISGGYFQEVKKREVKVKLLIFYLYYATIKKKSYDLSTPYPQSWGL